MNRHLLVYIFLFSFQLVIAQVHCYVIDSGTKEAVSFARIESDDFAGITNGQGYIYLPNDSSVFSIYSPGYIGETLTFIDSIESISIQLKKMRNWKDQKLEDGYKYVMDIIDRFHVNYYVKKHKLEASYQELMTLSGDSMYHGEGTFDVYIPDNILLNDGIEKIIATVNDINVVEHQKFKKRRDVLRGNVCDMSFSSMWRKGSFFDRSKVYDYQFFKALNSNVDNELIQVVDFEPKNENGSAVGRMYIDKKTLAVVRLEYFPLNRPDEWEQIKWIEEYDQYGREHYTLSKVNYFGIVKTINGPCYYTADLRVNGIKKYNELPADQFYYGVDYSLFDMEPSDEAQLQDDFKEISSVASY